MSDAMDDAFDDMYGRAERYQAGVEEMRRKVAKHPNRPWWLTQDGRVLDVDKDVTPSHARNILAMTKRNGKQPRKVVFEALKRKAIEP